MTGGARMHAAFPSGPCDDASSAFQKLGESPRRPSDQSPIHEDCQIKIYQVCVKWKPSEASIENTCGPIEMGYMWIVRSKSDQNPDFSRSCHVPNPHRTNQSAFDMWHMACHMERPDHFCRNLMMMMIDYFE
jgi:hypothetical protein